MPAHHRSWTASGLVAVLALVALLVPSAATAADDPPLVGTAVPVVAGSAQVGTRLQVRTPGTWTPAPTSRAYQWLLDGAPIAGAGGTSYRVVAADVAHQLSVRETATRAGYADAATVSNSRTGALGVFDGGSAIVGTQVPMTVGTTVDTDFGSTPMYDAITYAWLRDRSLIAGATTEHYRIVRADAGHRIKVRASYTRAGYRPGGQTIPVGRVRAYNAVRPSVTGTSRVGRWLVGDTGTWFGDGYHYHGRWSRDGKQIRGAFGSTYRLTRADRGHRVAFLVVARKPSFPTVRRSTLGVSVG